jgi:hypothetical protein
MAPVAPSTLLSKPGSDCHTYVSMCCVMQPLQAKARKVVVRKARQAVEAMTRPPDLATLPARRHPRIRPRGGGDSLRQEVR